jgi:hypothetical protein
MNRTDYTETAATAAVQTAGRQHVINLDDARDTYAPLIARRLARLQTGEDRGRALVDLTDLAEAAEELARIAREARAALKANG